MKTPEEIKKGLECCSNKNTRCRKDCPYFDDGSLDALIPDALALIKDLEEAKRERDKLAEELDKIKRERDAAIADLKSKIPYIDDGCELCAYYVECRGTDCPHYESGVGGTMTSEDGTVKELPDFEWECIDFDYGSCDLRKGTPCETCHDFVKNWEWRGMREVEKHG